MVRQPVTAFTAVPIHSCPQTMLQQVSSSTSKNESWPQVDHAIFTGFGDVYRGVAALVDKASFHSALREAKERARRRLCK